MKKFFQLIGIIFAFCLSINVSAVNYPDVPKPFRYVSDYAQALSQPDQQILEKALAEYGQKTSSQIAVVIVPTTEGEDIATYAFTLFNQWGIGRAKQNNGILLLIAKNDRHLFIATGRGLEGALPDAVAASIIRNDITPYFKQNQYAQGIAKGLSSIIMATQGEYAPLAQVDSNEQQSDSNGFIAFLIIGFVIIMLFGSFGRGNRTYISPSTAGRIIHTVSAIHRNGEFRDSFGGGNSGSNGGFGGGNTGGGGAGGSW